MQESGFYRFGQIIGGKFNQAKWVWASFTGSEADAIQAEYTVGRNLATILYEEIPDEMDLNTQKSLHEISNKLTAAVHNKLHRFEVTTIAEGYPTAFALPGGFIFVDQSFLALCDQDEIAFVVAHEMAHVIKRHAINRLLGQTALSVASLATTGKGWLIAWVKKVGLQGLERAYTCEQEFEADVLGSGLMKAAGFDPNGAIRLLRRLREFNQTSNQTSGSPYLSTHPTIEKRIARLRLEAL